MQDVIGAALHRRQHRHQPLLHRLAELDPGESVAPRLLAATALKIDDQQLAEFWFQRLKLASPLDPTSYAGLAAIYLSRGEKTRALPELAELANHETSDPRYALQLAAIYNEIKQPDQALVWLTEAMHIDPFNPATHLALADAHLALNQPDEAVKENKVAIGLDADNDGYWARLAFVYDAQGKKDLARTAARFAVRINPASPAAALVAQPAAPTSQPDGG